MKEEDLNRDEGKWEAKNKGKWGSEGKWGGKGNEVEEKKTCGEIRKKKLDTEMEGDEREGKKEHLQR